MRHDVNELRQGVDRFGRGSDALQWDLETFVRRADEVWREGKRFGKGPDTIRVEARSFGVAPTGCGMTGSIRRQPPIAMGEELMSRGEAPRDFGGRWMDFAGASTACGRS